jgi:hypothetical protein
MQVNDAVANRRPQPESTFKPLFLPYRLGNIELTNRLVMAPMTRSRALEQNVPNPLAATYYAQRASAELIVTEATQVTPQGPGTSAPRASIPRSRLPVGRESPRRCIVLAAKSFSSYGMSDVSRTRISMAASFRLRPRQ